jgi:hypothetical protein
MALATRSDRTWLNNARRILARRLHRTPSGARWWGMVRMLSHELGLPLKSAARVADLVLQGSAGPHRVRIAATSDGAVALRIDLERFHSTANALLSAAFAFGKSRAPGRPPKPRRRRPLMDVVPGAREIRVEHEPEKLEGLSRQLREWNAYPRGIQPGLPFIMDAATLRAVTRLPLTTSRGDIDVRLVETGDANGARSA